MRNEQQLTWNMENKTMDVGGDGLPLVPISFSADA